MDTSSGKHILEEPLTFIQNYGNFNSSTGNLVECVHHIDVINTRTLINNMNWALRGL